MTVRDLFGISLGERKLDPGDFAWVSRNLEVGVTGLEPVTSSLSSWRLSKSSQFLPSTRVGDSACRANWGQPYTWPRPPRWPSLAGIGNGPVRETLRVTEPERSG